MASFSQSYLSRYFRHEPKAVMVNALFQMLQSNLCGLMCLFSHKNVKICTASLVKNSMFYAVKYLSFVVLILQVYCSKPYKLCFLYALNSCLHFTSLFFPTHSTNNLSGGVCLNTSFTSAICSLLFFIFCYISSIM